MLKEIAIGDKKIDVLSNAATPIYYKRVFHEDLIVAMSKMQGAKSGEMPSELPEMLPNLAYIMHMQADKKMDQASTQDYLAWLEEFEAFDFIEAAADIFGVYNINRVQTSKSKNL